MPTVPTEIKSLARAYTKKGIEVLGGYVTSDQVEPDVKLRAIAMLFDRGWGRPEQDTTNSHEIKGELQITLRKLLSGEPESGDE